MYVCMYVSKTGIGDIFNNNHSLVFRCRFRIRMKKQRNAKAYGKNLK